MTSMGVAREKLQSDVAALTKDIEEFIAATAGQADKGVSSLRQRILATLDSGKNILNGERGTLKEKSAQEAKVAMDFARENPWSVAGAAVGAVAVLGVLLWKGFMR